MLPLKLEKLHPFGAFKVLPIQLLNRTQYLKEDEIFEETSKIKAVRYVEELTVIIQRLKPLSDKDFASKMYSYCQINLALVLIELARRAIQPLKDGSFTLHSRKFCTMNPAF